jgi:sulfoquinovose isomerase
MNDPALQSDFEAETDALLRFGARSQAQHGFGWLTDDGSIDPGRGVQLWVTGRMTHCFALGRLLGEDWCGPVAEHGVHCLLDGPLADAPGNGWSTVVGIDGTDRRLPRQAYDHSFVILAASSGLAAGIDGSADLLDRALRSFDSLWWDETAGMVLDSRDPVTGVVDPYRGANANMHTVEALLAAWAATGDRVHLSRAFRITSRILKFFMSHDFRLPEHFNASWEPQLSYNSDALADAFRPFGSTIGHWLEWSRLILEVRNECRSQGIVYPPVFDNAPQHMYRKALAEGWGPDGHPGFVYTVDFKGRPVVRQRMYWVLCEAIGAAATLSHVNHDESYALDIRDYWSYARTCLIEKPGQWREELDENSTPSDRTWSGKPDIYHALQAMLIYKLPVGPSFAAALAGQR